jgi:lipopolysaccharide cholinephosphotransferase
MPFEDRTFSVFAGYEEYLRGVYGDYMQLPPEDKRVGHHFDKAYWIS